MQYLKEREELIKAGIKLIDTGLTSGTGGNLSIFIRKDQLMLITPSGIPYHQIELEDLVLMDLNGNVIAGEKEPSCEHEMHSILYRTRDDIDAVVHTHTVFSTALSTLRVNLPPIHYMIAVAGGNDVKCAEYAAFGTKELAINAEKAMRGRYAALLANHGMLVGSDSLANALNITEQIEYVSHLYLITQGLSPVLLTEEEMSEMMGKFKDYGRAKE